MNNRYIIKNILTGALVESWGTAEQAIRACKIVNSHSVDFCKSFARYVVIDINLFYYSLNFDSRTGIATCYFIKILFWNLIVV